jgi:hypothetical protein
MTKIQSEESKVCGNRSTTVPNLDSLVNTSSDYCFLFYSDRRYEMSVDVLEGFCAATLT